MILSKSKEWLKRYLPSEIVGTVAALGSASIAQIFYKNPVIIAYIATLGEAIGFYLTVLVQNILFFHRRQEIEKKIFSPKHLLKILTNLILEFGPAGVIDGLFLRPFFMFLFPLLLKDFIWGIFIGKIAGDITFYAMVIISYEIGKRRNTLK